MSRDLPEFPNLDHLRKQAKALLRELRQHSPAVKLSQAQHKIARQYGFASWPKLKAHVESLTRVTSPSTATDAGGGATTSGQIPLSHDSGGGLFLRFTESARRTIFFARYFADGKKPIDAGDLLLGLIQANEDLMNRLLPGRFEARPAPGREERARLKASLLERTPKFNQGIESRSTPSEDVTRVDPLSGEFRRILEQAAKEADRLGHQKISTGHFLLGFVCDEVSQATPILTDILKEQGVRLGTFRRRIVRFLKEELG